MLIIALVAWAALAWYISHRKLTATKGPLSGDRKRGDTGHHADGTGEQAQQERIWRQRVKDNRNTAAMAFVGILVALAYQGAVSPAIQYINGSVSVLVVSQFVIFVVLGLWTFLLGSYTMTLSPFEGWAWFANFLLLMLSGFLLIFMASATVSSAKAPTRVSFIEYYIVYFSIEALWAVGTLWWAGGNRLFRQQFPFAACSFAPFISVLIIKFANFSHSRTGIIILMAVTVAAFASTIGLLARKRWI